MQKGICDQHLYAEKTFKTKESNGFDTIDGMYLIVWDRQESRFYKDFYLYGENVPKNKRKPESKIWNVYFGLIRKNSDLNSFKFDVLKRTLNCSERILTYFNQTERIDLASRSVWYSYFGVLKLISRHWFMDIIFLFEQLFVWIYEPASISVCNNV